MPLKANQFKQVFTRRTARLNTVCNICVPILCRLVHLPCLGTLSFCLFKWICRQLYTWPLWNHRLVFYELPNPFRAGDDLHVIIIKCSKIIKSPLFELTGSKKTKGLGGVQLTFTSQTKRETVSNGNEQNLKILFSQFN